MPLSIASVAGGTSYADPMVGKTPVTANLRVDLSTLTTDMVDADGYIKPGVILEEDGDAISANTSIAWGVVIEATKLNLATLPPTNTSLGNETGDHDVGVAVFGLINRDVAEDNMGRAYTANELLAIANAASRLAITQT